MVSQLASQFAWLKPYRERLGNSKGGATKKIISKRSILINRIKEIYENNPYKHIENIVESFLTSLQRCIELEGDRTGYLLFIHLIISFEILKYKNKTTSDIFCVDQWQFFRGLLYISPLSSINIIPSSHYSVSVNNRSPWPDQNLDQKQSFQ